MFRGAILCPTKKHLLSKFIMFTQQQGDRMGHQRCNKQTRERNCQKNKFEKDCLCEVFLYLCYVCIHVKTKLTFKGVKYNKLCPFSSSFPFKLTGTGNIKESGIRMTRRHMKYCQNVSDQLKNRKK